MANLKTDDQWHFLYLAVLAESHRCKALYIEVWEGSHGTEEKIMKQAIYLPHQTLGSLFAAGKIELIAGKAVPCFKALL